MTNPILTLRVAKYNDEPLAEPIAVRFGPDGGTIGRATTCTLVLPDQQRAISRVHARVECRGGEYLLCDLGANPSVLNQRALGGTREARLAHGDQLMIGAYLLEVALAEGAAQDEARPFGHDPLAGVQVLRGAPEAEDLTLPENPLVNPFAPGGYGQAGGTGAAAAGAGRLDALGAACLGTDERVVARPGYAGSESDHVAPELQALTPPALTPAASPASLSGAGGIPADYDPLADALAQWESGGSAAPAQVPTTGAAAPGVATPGVATPGAFSPHVAPAMTPVPPLMPPPMPASLPAFAAMPGAADPLGLGAGGPTGLPASLLGDAAPHGATPFDDLFAPAAPASPGSFAPPAQPAAAAQAAPRELLPSVTQIFAPAAPSQPEPPPPVQAKAEEAPTPPRQATPGAAPGITPAPAPIPTPAPAAPAPAPQPTARAAAPAAAAPVSTDEQAMLAALLEGLGLDAGRAPNLPAADLARLVGAMLRDSLRGTMAVLRARSMTKREARLDTTLIVERDNNPLKFFPDVDSALAQMLTGRAQGYLPPAEAVARAFVDIESHELAVLVGMRAALSHVLARFDPATLEAQLSEQGVLDRVLSNRKAKLWDRFVELRAGIAREAEDDFQKLFGKAFNEAYEAQVDAMQRAREASRTTGEDAQTKPKTGPA
ncbi:type VI secretion system-associated FHA domain protein TagH [Paraburkholderia pallida]|uniref:Type VI secretion system-associated FHA domain protein TagH n=1 Tax=Paraburkholderia pallida TaxID=2547399 RepID=A0A4P7CWT1_9BURK|nr:type VI secretion system-associated FHA domain protein TagH [Paraburkholderia pallida]